MSSGKQHSRGAKGAKEKNESGPARESGPVRIKKPGRREPAGPKFALWPV